MEGKGSPRDNESQTGKIAAVLISFSVLSTIIVGLRCFTRVRLLHSFGYEDIFIIMSQFMAIASAVVIGLEAKWGLGRHVWMQDPNVFVPYMKAFYASVVVYSTGMCLLKISILLQYRRIFAVPIMRKATTVGLIFEGCWTITITFLQSLMCLPVAAFWDSSVGGRCLNKLTIWYINASINLATDFIVFSMPLPLIKRLQLRRPQKVMLFFIFCLGFFACIISVIRLRTLSNASDLGDSTWDNVDAALWSFLELTVGIICTSLPTLRPLLVKITPRVFGSLTPRSHATESQYPHSHATELHSARTWRQITTKKDSDSTSELFGKGEESAPGRASDNDGNGTYNVVVTGGKPDPGWRTRRSSSLSNDQRPARGGITATTQVTQEIEISRHT